MADRRRRSPEGSSKRRKDYKQPDYNEPPRMRSGVESQLSSSSSSSSSSYIDISRTFPNRTGLRAFFTSPSERRRLRKRRSSRLLKLNNSSSSSINSDLAYGTGFIKRPKTRGVRSRKGKEIDRERHRDYNRERDTVSVRGEKDRSSLSRAATDAEIIAVGAGLAKLARDQNKLDLKGSRTGKRSEAFSVKQSSNGYDNAASRGLGPSKVSHGSDTVDEDGWESASDAGSDSSVDSRLAFGGDAKGGWFGWGRASHKPQSRKSSVVDPELFGPANSLHGIVTQPVGFGNVSWDSSSDFGRRGPVPPGPAESIANGSQVPLQHVYPIPTSDPSRFETARSSVVSGAEPYMYSRPPLQQPQPIAPVSQSVYEPSYSTRGEPGILQRSSSPSGRSQSLAQAALVGVAGAAVGAVVADYRDDRSSKRRESDRKEDRDDRRREKRNSPDRYDRKERRQDKDRQKDTTDDQRRDKRREKRRDEGRDEGRDERREKRREDRHSERPEYESRRTKSEASVSTTAVDPFQYQVDDDAFSTPTPSSPVHGRMASVPTVVTVDREPSFTRNTSSSIKDESATPGSEARRDDSEWDDKEQRYRKRDSRDRALHDAETIYQETEHSTAPIDAVAIGAAVAAVTAEEHRESRSDRRRDERRGRREYDDYDSTSHKKESSKRDREPERDPIQEEADRAYREIVMARKIASQVIRSRTPSPDRSVIDKYDKDKDQEEEIVRIVTPPGMEDHKKEGPYDAPNADFKLDLVMEDPRELHSFGIPSITFQGSNPGGPFPKLDPDASEPRPLLNLVRPTPTPSPIPEKQAAREEKTKPSKPKERETSASASDVVIDNKGDVVSSPVSSPVSKGVTWGENETKHYEVESPHEHRDEFVTSPEIQAQDRSVPKSVEKSEEKPKSSNSGKRGAWAAITAGIIGANAGTAVASSSETSKSTENEKPSPEKRQDDPYEYRGVIVEPDITPRRRGTRSPPATGPKPSGTPSSRVPGAFDDDLDFTATVAAGLQDTGFDPNIVIDDPSFRRRDSPPGSNQTGIYRAPFAETVSDLGSIPVSSSTAKEAAEEFDNDEFTTKLSKKEQKKREKSARRQSGDIAPLKEDAMSRSVVDEPEPLFETKLSKKEQKKRDKAAQRQGSQGEDVTPSVAEELVEEPESYFETPKKSKSKKSKRNSSANEDGLDDSRDDRKVSVPVDAFDDIRSREEEWNEPKKSKKKSKRDSERFDSPSRSAAPEVIPELERSSSKKSKDKTRRKSEQYEPEADPTEVSLPPSTPSESSRAGDFEEIRNSRKSSTKDSTDRDDSRSVVSADASRYIDDDDKKSKKKSRGSSRDDYDDTRSVVSAPAGDDFGDGKKSKKKDKKSGGGFFGLFGSKSESGVTEESPKESKDDFEEIKKKSKKSKRNSVPDGLGLYGDLGSQSGSELPGVSSNGNGHRNGSHPYDDANDEARSDDDMKSGLYRGDSPSSKKDSFLAKAGTLGAGVGLASAAAAITAQQHQRSKADKADSSERSEQPLLGSSVDSQQQHHEIFDPEITQRQFRPSIDPQYGDLLPLPPSDPVSPNVETIDDLPDLPDSRPDTPEAERLARDKAPSSVRRTAQETPMKSPSQSAVPLKFIMGNRSTPSSPSLVRSSPMQSPATPREDSLSFPRSRPRPTSWDSSKEYKPLYLVESNRRASTVQQQEPEGLPSLPPSQRTSRSSSQLDASDSAVVDILEQHHLEQQVSKADPLSTSTTLRSTESPQDFLDSQQSTPKLEPKLDDVEPLTPQHDEDFNKLSTLPTLPRSRSLSAGTEDRAQSHDRGERVTNSSGYDGLISSIGYFASSPTHRSTKESWLEELPSRSSIQRQPSPVEPMTKDRSSYLLRSSPLSEKASPVEPMTKDRSSYLLRSSPLSEKVDDAPSSDPALDSPVAHHVSTFSDGETLHSIQEREGNNIFGEITQPDFEKEHGIQSSPFARIINDAPSEQETSKDIADIKNERQVPPEKDLESTPKAVDEETQPAEEDFGVIFKKNKKKDKKKGKGSSSTSIIDPTPLPAVSQVSHQNASISGDAVVLEEIPSKQTKKGGGNNGLSGSSIQDNISMPDPIQETLQKSLPEEEAEQTENVVLLKSKKDKKRDKKKARSSGAWDVQDEDVPPQPSQEVTATLSEDIPPETSAADDFWAPTSKKSKKDKKKGKSGLTWEPQQEEETITPQTLLASESIGDSDVKEEGLSALSLGPKEEKQAIPAPEPTVAETADYFEAPVSKKNKKKGKKSRAWIQEDEPTSESISESTKAMAEPEISGLKLDVSPTPTELDRSKRILNSQVSQASDAGLEPSQAQIPETLAEPEQPTAVSLPKESREEKEPNVHVQQSPEIKLQDRRASADSVRSAVDDAREVIEENTIQEDSLGQQQDLPSSKATPAGGPSAWLVTPAIPWTRTGEGANDSPSKDYFPSAASLHSPRSQETSDEPKSRGYFPSAVAVLPFFGVGKERGDLEKGAENLDPISAEPHIIEIQDLEQTVPPLPQEIDEPHNPQEAQAAPSLPDGLKVGYDNEQLSLARQLQEEFSSGSKSSKKNKKKRQSLPSTPNSEASRSRSVAGGTEIHPRARSLSIAPAENIDGAANAEEGKGVYNEEQLEFARQLKAEFELGSKKSKKDKKKRPGLISRSSTQDDGNLEEPIIEEKFRELEPEAADDFGRESFSSQKDTEKNSETASKHLPSDDRETVASEAIGNEKDSASRENQIQADGLVVGYQEDQLSLARQLQAEFNSGSKKSKKDKKRRSASQTPVQQADTHGDYFGELSGPTDPNISKTDDMADSSRSETIDKLPERDGLAVGYNVDQLELARQLKEEFGSGSKKSKKERKRQSVSRGISVDSSSAVASDQVSSNGNDATDLQPANVNDRGTIEAELDEQSLEPGAEFAINRKKSKKYKKEKRRGISASELEKDFSSGLVTKDEPPQEPSIDVSQTDHDSFDHGTNDFTNPNPISEPVLSAKIDENTNESLPDRISDGDSPYDFGKEVEALHRSRGLDLSNREPEIEVRSGVTFPDDNVHLPVKGLVLEEKTPSSDLVQDESFDSPEKATHEHLKVDSGFLPSATSLDTSAETTDKPLDDFAFPSKKSKKAKKKQRGIDTSFNLEQSADQGTNEEDTKPTEPPHESTADTTTTLAPSDVSEFTLKKSKKDKKKRQSAQTSVLTSNETTVEQPGLVQLSEFATDHDNRVFDSNNQDIFNSNVVEKLAGNIADTPEDTSFSDYAFTTTSKKDKKKGKRSSVAESREQSGSSTPLDPFSKPADFAEISLPTENLKEKMAVDDAPPMTSFSTTNAPAESTSDKVTEPEEDWGTFSIKKSKKDKKKKSGLSTPIQAMPIQEPVRASEIEDSNQFNIQESDRNLHNDQEGESSAQTHVEDSIAEPLGYTTKSSKKQKKKRKSGLSTPLEEALPVEAPITERDAITQPNLLASAELENTDTSATQDFRQLRSGEFEREAMSTSEPVLLEHVVAGQNNEKPLTSEQPFTYSVPLEKELPTEELLPVKVHNHDPAAPEGDAVKPVETVSSGILEQKPSKIEKRKRQPPVDATGNDETVSVKLPLTSWADEVEEAEIEMRLPIMEDIAKNESLSKIPSTMDANPADDFIRPNKKGKKGKKRDSGLFVSSSKDDQHGSEVVPKSEQKPQGDNPTVIAAGALTAAALIAGINNDHPSTEMTRSTAPTRKLSKKEKRKKSIDRRSATQDDIFDDPSLWEGEKPRAFEEPGAVEDDASSDGFWASPHNDRDIATHSNEQPIFPEPTELSPHSSIPAFSKEPEEQPGSPKQNIVDPLRVGTPQLEEMSNTSNIPLIESQGVQQDNFADEFVAISSKNNKKKSQSRLSEWDSASRTDEPLNVRTSTPPSTSSEPARAIIEESVGSNQHSGGDGIQETISMPATRYEDSNTHDQNIPFQKSLLSEYEPLTHPNATNYGHPGSSTLPVVREESPLPTEFEHNPPRYPHPHTPDDTNRDSAFVTESPIPRQRGFADSHEHIRDSGVHLRDFSPAPISATDDAIARMSWPAVDEETETVDLHKSQQPKTGTSIEHHEKRSIDNVEPSKRPEGKTSRQIQELAKHQTVHDHHAMSDKHSSVQSQTGRSEKLQDDRSHDRYMAQQDEKSTVQHPDKKDFEYLRKESPIGRREVTLKSRDLLPSQRSHEEKRTELHRTPTIHRSQKPKEGSSVMQRVERIESPDSLRSQRPKQDRYADLNISQRPQAEKPTGFNDNSMGVGAALGGATIGFAAARQSSREHRPASAASNRSSSNINRLRTPDPKYRPESVGSNRSSATPPLRRSDRKSGDLRSLSQHSKPDLAKEAELAATAIALTATAANPTANEGRVRAKDMADVYDGFGEGRMGSPRSPTRPHSMRRRQSMQVLDLESRLEQLAAENRILAEAKAQAERTLQTTQHSSAALVERDAEIDSLKRTLDWLQHEVTRLTEVNDGLTSANITLGNQHNDRYGMLESQHVQATRELAEIRNSHNTLSTDVETRVKNEIQIAVQDKDQEIAQLRAQLEAAKEQIREMQRQILASKANDSEFLTIRDEDYFDTACQQLCQHVQQWVLRFSKFSDMRACRLTSEINNDKIIDRLDNAILDGSDVDSYLADRVKRRDVFMSMTMTMVWEFVFTRYLFGMDREQRQKLKSLEKLLLEVGPAAAVHQWRATTLTLLSKREAFVQQREQDTLAVVNAILETLTEILPPPSHLEDQIQEQLVRVMKAAVDLSIEMRTQRAEYMMLPPLQPEYDANGDLASKVSFNAALMNERSGDTVSNEELEAAGAVVRIVLFPLVVKKGDDSGEGDEEIVVCPAQVLVAKPKKTVRVFTPESMAHQNHSRVSMQSSMPADYGDHSVV